MTSGGGQAQTSIGDVMKRVREAAREDDLKVETVLEALGPHSLAALLVVPAFLAATPLSGIPGVSIVCGLLIALISAQMLLSYDEAYVPAKLRTRSVKANALRKAIDTAAPVIDWIDRHTRPRLASLFHHPLIDIPKVICLLSGLAMPFLEFIPFSSSVVAGGVSLMAIALLTRDGLFFLLALLPYAGLAYLLLRLL